MAEVEEAYQTREKNHGNSWTSEQLREWANMYQTKEQASLDVPPSGHFFCKKDDKMSSQTKNEGRSDNCKFFEPLNCIKTIDSTQGGWHYKLSA